MSKTNIMKRLDCLIVCTVYSLCARVTMLCSDLICFLDATRRYVHIVIDPMQKEKWLCTLHTLLCDEINPPCANFISPCA